jgi:hypothetical protein
MGTNYYSVHRSVDLEQFDGWDLRYSEDGCCLHIGKSSGGWCFSLHVIPERGINSLRDWIEVFIDPERVIIDEYRDEVDLERMMRVITCRSRDTPNGWDEETLDRNCAEPGPNNLVRHRMGDHCDCVGHGEGTWDLITGDFS